MSSVASPLPVDARAVLAGVHVAPSILAADCERLGEHVQEVLDAGARVVHFDVMDGHFVAPITFGANVVGALADRVHDAGGVVDVHLMVEWPERRIDEFARAGADVITVHHEATAHLHYALGAIRAAGCLAGVAINPATPADQVAPVAAMLDLALCMTVNPGWGGQPFIDSTLEKIERLRELLGATCVIEVDGGVDATTAPECVRRGANLLVAGSAVFGAASPGAAMRALTGAVNPG